MLTALSNPERRVLKAFREFLITPGQMLCFYGPNLSKNKAALQQLTEKKMLVKEDFPGAYTLTNSGYEAMRGCDGEK